MKKFDISCLNHALFENFPNTQAFLIEGVAGSGKSTLITQQLGLHLDQEPCLLLSFSRTGVDVLKAYCSSTGFFPHPKLSIRTIDSLALEAIMQLGDERYLLSDDEVIRYILPEQIELTCEQLWAYDFYAPQVTAENMALILKDLDYFRASLAYQTETDDECEMICADRLHFDWRFIRKLFERYEETRYRWLPSEQNHLHGFDFSQQNNKTEGFRRISEAISDLYDYENFGKISLFQDFKYYFIDEFHDVSPLQLDFLKHIIKNNQKIMVVGDRYQNIFAWRGTDTEVVFNEYLDYFNAITVHQNKSYRFGLDIAKLASKTIQKTILSNKQLSSEIVIIEQPNSPIFQKKEQQSIVLLAQNHWDLFKAVFDYWEKTQGKLSFSYGLSQLFIISFINVLYTLKNQKLSSYKKNALKSLTYDLKRFYQADFCFLNLEAQESILKTLTLESFLSYTQQQLKMSSEHHFFEAQFVEVLNQFLDSNQEITLFKLLTVFEKNTPLFNTKHLDSDFNYLTWQHFVKYFQKKGTTLEDWPKFYYSIANSWNTKTGLNCMTITQAKGKEFEQVILYPADLNGFVNYQLEQETQRNAFYVGITRAKKKLYLWS